MAHTSFASLPAELVLQIGVACDLSFDDRLNLASVNSQIREIFAPSIFSTLRFSNEEEDADDVGSTIASVGQHVRRLWFECNLYPNPYKGSSQPESDDEGSLAADDASDNHEDDEYELPAFTVQILSGHPSLAATSIVVEFKPETSEYEGEYWGDADEIGAMWLHQFDEDEAEILEQERRCCWRRVMADSWRALSRNVAIRSLEIYHLFPRETSAWSQPSWKRFLGQLNDLSIELWGFEVDGASCCNVFGPYIDFQRRLSQNFFRHAHALRALHISASDSGPLGSEGHGLSCAMPLHYRHMPNLESLKLKNCILDTNLETLLVDSAKTIKCLILSDCHSRAEDPGARKAPTWDAFFRAIQSAESVLEKLHVVYEDIEFMDALSGMTEEELMSDQGANAVVTEELKTRMTRLQAIRELARNERRQLFSYVSLDDKYGWISPMEARNSESVEAGVDEREYDALQEMIKTNNAKRVREA